MQIASLLGKNICIFAFAVLSVYGSGELVTLDNSHQYVELFAVNQHPMPEKIYVPEVATAETTMATGELLPDMIARTMLSGLSRLVYFSLPREEFVEMYPTLGGKVKSFVAKVDDNGLDLRTMIPISTDLGDYVYIESFSPDGSKTLVVTFDGYSSSRMLLASA